MSAPVFRASHSVLKNWSTGIPERQDEAIRQLFHFPMPPNEAMKQGKELHKQFENQIKETGKHPALFGVDVTVLTPSSEEKIVINAADWLDVVGVIDFSYVRPETGAAVIEDFKTGRTPSSEYLSSYQFGMYVLLYEKKYGIPVEQVIIRHYNQYTNFTDTSYIWVEPLMKESALDWLLTHSSEMYTYLLENNVYDDPYAYFGQERRS